MLRAVGFTERGIRNTSGYAQIHLKRLDTRQKQIALQTEELEEFSEIPIIGGVRGGHAQGELQSVDGNHESLCGV